MGAKDPVVPGVLLSAAAVWSACVDCTGDPGEGEAAGDSADALGDRSRVDHADWPPDPADAADPGSETRRSD